MKKYVMLFSFTVLIIALLYSITALFAPPVPNITVLKLKASELKTTIDCSGEIEAKNRKAVYYSMPLKAGKIYAEIGDQVKLGQRLINVEKNDTIETFNNKIISNEQNQSVDNIPSQQASGMSPEQYNTLLKQYQQKKSENTPTTIGSSDVPAFITAPISGVVTEINASDGDFTSPSEPVIVISDLNSLRVKAQVEQNFISQVKVGQNVILKASGSRKQFSGTVSRIYPAARQIVDTTGTRNVVDVLINIAKPEAQLKPGLAANVNIIVSDNPKSISVPYDAVLEDNNNVEYVYVLRNSKVHRQNIETGQESSNNVEVVKGLREGDLLITEPPDSLYDGQIVKSGLK